MPGREERMIIMANIIEKRSIVHQVSVAKDNLGLKEDKDIEKTREVAKTNDRNSMKADHNKVNTTVKASSWKEAAAAAGVTLIEASEHIEKEEMVQKKKKKTLKEMRTGSVKRKESGIKITESEKKCSKRLSILTRQDLKEDMPNITNQQTFCSL